MKTPYIGFGNEQLENQPIVKKGDEIICPDCGMLHKIKYGKDSDGNESDMLGFYNCGEKTMLASINGKLVAGLKAAYRGEVEI